MHARVGARPRARRLSDSARHETDEEEEKEEEVEDRDISRVYAVAIDIRTSTSSADPSRSRRLPPAFLPSSRRGRCFPSHLRISSSWLLITCTASSLRDDLSC